MKPVNILLILVIVFALTSFTSKPVKDGYYQPEKFVGKVKSVVRKDYVNWGKSDGILDNPLKWSSTIKSTFDEAGFEREIFGFNKTGRLIYSDTIKYDDKGHRLDRLFHNNNGTLFSRIKYKYDSLGQKIDEVKYKKGYFLQERISYKYDELGNCTEWNHYDSNEVFKFRQVFTYDSFNNNIRMEWLWPHQSDPSVKHVYRYNDKGQEVESKFYRQSDSLINNTILTYDKRGNLLKTKSIYTKDKHLENQINSYVYKYDKAGNWVRRAIKSKGKIGYLTIRTIEYY